MVELLSDNGTAHVRQVKDETFTEGCGAKSEKLKHKHGGPDAFELQETTLDQGGPTEVIKESV